MRPDIIVTPAAEMDIADAIDWYKSHGPLSSDFRLAFEAALCRIAVNPESSAVIVPGLRRALVTRFPHGVLYRLSDTTIQIVAVLHTGRNPLIWQERNH